MATVEAETRTEARASREGGVVISYASERGGGDMRLQIGSAHYSYVFAEDKVMGALRDVCGRVEKVEKLALGGVECAIGHVVHKGARPVRRIRCARPRRRAFGQPYAH